MGQKWSGTNTISQSTAPPSSKVTPSKPSMTSKPFEREPKDTKSSSSASTSLRTDDASKQKANNEPLYENLSYKSFKG